MMDKSPQNRLKKRSVLRPAPVAQRIYLVNIMPLSFLLLIFCAVIFSVFTVTSGSVAIKGIEITPPLQAATGKQSWKNRENWNYSDPEYQPLLTLFTTFKNRKDQRRIHWNVIQNWSLFQPKVQFVLFNDNTDRNLLQFAHNLNWTILPAPPRDPHGTHILKEMFHTCQKYMPNSVFIGYVNAESLFDRGLAETLEVLCSSLEQMNKSLIVGARTYFNVRDRPISTLEEVQKITNTEGELVHPGPEDYFFLLHNGFPWETMPEIAINRLQYANYFVATAHKHGIAVVDATQTLVALHQTGYNRNFPRHKYTDSQHDIQVMGHFDHSKGLTTISQYVTQYNKSGHVELWRRSGVQGPSTLITLKMPRAQTPATLTNITKYKFNTNINSFQSSLSTVTRNEYQEQLDDPAVSMNFKEDIGQGIIDDVLEDEPSSNCADHHILTLFTIFTPDVAYTTFHMNILQNWAKYHPNITTVLFADANPTDIDTMSRQLNWTVLPTIPQTGASLPLKKMFLQVQHLYPQSMYYGYIKGDLLFGEGLVNTLQEIAAALGDDLDSALLVGAKYQYVVKPGQEIYEPSVVDTVIRVGDWVTQSDIDENFVLAHHLFPWQHIPDLVIGHSVYDNYLVALALRYDFAVVDATRTLTALQQMPKDASLFQTKPDDFDPNLLAALDYSEGYVTSAQYETTYDASGKVKLWRRQTEGKELILLSQP